MFVCTRNFLLLLVNCSAWSCIARFTKKNSLPSTASHKLSQLKHTENCRMQWQLIANSNFRCRILGPDSIEKNPGKNPGENPGETSIWKGDMYKLQISWLFYSVNSPLGGHSIDKISSRKFSPKSTLKLRYVWITNFVKGSDFVNFFAFTYSEVFREYLQDIFFMMIDYVLRIFCHLNCRRGIWTSYNKI